MTEIQDAGGCGALVPGFLARDRDALAVLSREAVSIIPLNTELSGSHHGADGIVSSDSGSRS